MRIASRWIRWLGGGLLVLDAAVSGAFFASFWGVDAERVGRYDLGLALALSFASAVAVYASLALAAVSAVAAGVALVTRRPVGLFVAGLAIALLPIAYLWLLDARLLPLTR